MKIVKFTILMLMITMVWACGQSGDKETNVNDPNPQKEQVESPAGELDNFGRKPGDPHYGHNHASDEHSTQKTDATAKPAEGEVDKFGRKPGDQHYGHNHE